MRLEIGLFIDRVIHPHAGRVTEEMRRAYDAFQIPGYSSDEPNRTIHINNKRLGRRLISTSVDKSGLHTPHFAYFYDWVVGGDFDVRYGIEADHRSVMFYRSFPKEGREQVNYSFSLSGVEAEKFLKTMPKGPGDFGYLDS